MEFIKVCTLCDKEVKVQNKEDFKDYFYVSKSGKFGFASFCKTCASKEKKKFYKKYPEKMNCNKEKKNYINTCIVCNNEFKAREKKCLVCSDECRKVKNKIRKRIHTRENYEKQNIIKENIKAKAVNSNKHYTDKEIKKIERLRDKGLTIKEIALKMNRTIPGITKLFKKLNSSSKVL